VLHRLERILGLPRTHLARRSEEGGLWGPDLRYLSKRQRATVSLHLTPGSSYVDLDAGCRGSRWLVTATRSTYHHPRTTTTVHVYRWNRVTWVPRRNRIVSGRPASSLWRRIEFFPFDGERGCRLISAATHR
jgi:hypothetical protein